VVKCTVSGGFVLDCIWNYNVLQFVLCCVVCGAVYSEWWVCVGLYLEL